MSFKSKIHQKNGNILSFYVFYFLFILNSIFIKSKKIQENLWDLIKCELFYIGGQCKSSGSCCKSLMIFKKGSPINTSSDFKKYVTQHPNYSRFIPNLDIKNNIKHFSCSCLNKDNLCNDYKNRPKICHNYPLSSFLMYNKIYKGCGYFIEKKSINPIIRNKELKKLINSIILTN